MHYQEQVPILLFQIHLFVPNHLQNYIMFYMYMFTTPTIGNGEKADSYVEAEDLLVLARSTPKSGSETPISLLRLI